MKKENRSTSDDTDTSSFCMLNSGFSLRRPPSGVTFHRLMEKEPSHVLYATSARNRGIGLDSVAHETLRGTKDQLGLAIAYANRARDLDPAKFLDSPIGSKSYIDSAACLFSRPSAKEAQNRLTKQLRPVWPRS